MNVCGDEKDGDKKKNNLRWTQKPLVRQVAVSSCIWASYFQIGLFNGACPVLVAHLRREPLGDGSVVDDSAASWISSTGNFSAIPCVFLLGLMSEYLGRRLSYLFMCVATCASFVVLYCATSMHSLLYALLLQGPLVGGGMNVCLLIVSEYVSPKNRGVFLTIKCASVYWAMWVANAIGTFFHWKNICILGMVCAAYNTSLILFMPESPYWLASKGQIRKCRDAHRWLRGTDEREETELECLIKSEVDRSQQIEGGSTLYQRVILYVNKILASEFYRPIGLCTLLVLTYHLSGKFILSMYAIDILNKITDSESVAYAGMLILDGITVLGMYVGCIVSRYTKRRTLFFSSEFTAIFLLLILSFYLYLVNVGLIKENAYLSMSMLLLFSLSISCGPMILVTSLISEILPLELRTFAVIVQSMAANIIGGISLKVAPYIFSSFGSHGAFLYFTVGSLVCALMLLKFLPETRNKTLEEIESLFKVKNKLKNLKELVPLAEPVIAGRDINQSI